MGAVHLPSGHGVAWRAALARETWTYDDIVADSRLSYGQVQKLVSRWEEAGAVKATGVGPDRRTQYGVTDATVFDRLADVSEASPAPIRREQSDVGNMWTAMRGLATFSPVDISAQASTEEIEVTVLRAREYCRTLLRHNYLKVVRKAVPGKREPVYRLIRNTGPVAPREKRVTVLEDVNVPVRGRS
jgi:hypothetical protein